MPMEAGSDADLVERSLRHDAGAFGSLVERHQGLVFGVALARCGDPALAQDVAQDAFVTAWRDLPHLRDAGRIGSWVAGIARNLASSAARDRARRGDAVLPEPLPVATPEDEAVAREDRELLQRALAEVPDDHREVLVLHYLEGQPVAQIAAGLGIREDLVKQRLSRGRRALRDNVADRVESALARARPGRRFSAGVVAALPILATRKAVAGGATGKAMLLMSTNTKFAVAIAAVAIAGGAIWIARRAPDVEASAAPAATPVTRPKAPAPALAEASAPHGRHLHDAERATLVEKIHVARDRRIASQRPAASGEAATPVPALVDLDKEYIRQSVHELIPLLGECYEQALERDPTIAGDVVVDFTIEGEPGVGGVICDSKVDTAASTLTDATALECIQETMYALEIDPPANGGTVSVHYPFAFRPSP